MSVDSPGLTARRASSELDLLYDRKTPITSTDLVNDRVLPFFEQHDVSLLRILTDRGTEYCGSAERHDYELYLAVENIDHSRTKRIDLT